MKIFYITENYLLKTITMSLNDENNYFCEFPERVFIMGATEENEAFFNQLNDLEKQFLNTFSPSTLKDSSAIDIEYFRRKNTTLEFASGLPVEEPEYEITGDLIAEYVWKYTNRIVANNFNVISSDGSDVDQSVFTQNTAFTFDGGNLISTGDLNPEGSLLSVMANPIDDLQIFFEQYINCKLCVIDDVTAPKVWDLEIGQEYLLNIVKVENDDWSLYPDTRIFFGLGNPPPGLTIRVDGENFYLVVGNTWTGLEPYNVVCYIRDRELNQEIFRNTFEFFPAG